MSNRTDVDWRTEYRIAGIEQARRSGCTCDVRVTIEGNKHEPHVSLGHDGSCPAQRGFGVFRTHRLTAAGTIRPSAWPKV